MAPGISNFPILVLEVVQHCFGTTFFNTVSHSQKAVESQDPTSEISSAHPTSFGILNHKAKMGYNNLILRCTFHHICIYIYITTLSKFNLI